MPFITEELWQKLPHKGASIAIQDFPRAQPEFIDASIEREIDILEEVIIKIRNVRAEMNIDPAKRVQVNLASPDERSPWIVGSINVLHQELGSVRVDCNPSVDRHRKSLSPRRRFRN